MDVTIRTAEGSDFVPIVNFLQDYFFRDEPLNAAVGLLLGDPRNDVLANNTKQILDQGVSVVAEVGGELAGVCLNEIVPIAKGLRMIPQSPEPITMSDSVDKKFERIKILMETVDIMTNLSQRFPDLEKVFDTEMISVSPNFQGKGIAGKLLAAGRELALKNGVKLVRCICSSRYSAMVAERLGYECIFKLCYADFKDTSGQPVFKTEPPHTEMSAFVLRLEQ